VAELPPVAAQITEYQGHYRTCPDCGTLNHAAIPHDLKTHSIGPRLAATLGYLTGSHHLSKRGLEEVVEDVFEVPIALGTIAHLETQLSEALAPAHVEAVASVRAAEVKNVDETSWKLAGQLCWLWLAATDTVAAFLIHAKRGVQALQALLGEDIYGLVGSDRWSAYAVLAPLLRRGVLWRKNAFGSHSEKGCRFVERLLTVVLNALKNAEAIVLGDQREEYELWNGTQMQTILNNDIKGGKVVVGGSSAGMALLGGVGYLNAGGVNAAGTAVETQDGVTSRQAVADPTNTNPLIGFENNFVTTGVLKAQNVITDTHFEEKQSDPAKEPDPNLRGRMGRLVAFLARQQVAIGNKPLYHGIAADESTAVLVENNGMATVSGLGWVYFVTAAPIKKLEKPLDYPGVAIVKLDSKQEFNLETWKAENVPLYHVKAAKGTLSNTDNTKRDVYNNNLP
jgi:cyanophycinase-like exopeptidase